MKKLIIILALLAGPALLPAQTTREENSTTFQRNLQNTIDRTPPIVPQAKIEPLTKFNLDFKGGTPEDLVKAVEKAMGKHLNVMIPPDSKADQVVFPPLKLERVDVAQLFKTIGEANRKTAHQILNTSVSFGVQQIPQYTEYSLEYGFRPSSAAPLTDDTIWYFYNTLRDPIPEAAIAPQISCSYFQLESYLENTTIDAITTAINTSFELLNQSQPKMKFHPDTQLLIVAGTADQIQNISNLLRLLPGHARPGRIRAAVGMPLPPPALPAPRPAALPTPAPSAAPAPLPATVIEPANQ